MKRVARLAWLAAALAGLGPPVAQAAEMVVEGEVVRVVPLGVGEGEACRRPRPASGAGLVELLAWDLRVDCPPSAGSGSGYRVYYRWDGRTYSRVMSRPPGDTVSLRVRLQ